MSFCEFKKLQSVKTCILKFACFLSLLSAVSNGFGEDSTAIATNSPSTQVTREVDIGGRKLEMATRGQGAPAVIVEAGLGEPAVESGSWEKVVSVVSKTVRTCIYDRAGLGKSPAVTNSFRTTQDLADDLHALLVNAKIPPPYILVGHSIGGFTVRLYASKYPDEVAGVVLVDSAYPDQWQKWLALLPIESSQEPDSVKKMRALLAREFADPKNNPERLDLVASSAQVNAAKNLGDKPLVVIRHSRNWSMDPSLPKDVSDKFEKSWQEWQDDLCRLSTRSSHKIAVKAGHYIQPEEPQLVIDAVLEIVEATKP
jgi:pimeloyl-ACP methyl ester carboxylesterase